MTLPTFQPSDVTSALAIFGEPATEPEARRVALTALITAKLLPKQADHPAILEGRQHLMTQARDSVDPAHRLLGIAESIRLTQVVKRWAADTIEQLEPLFSLPLPEMRCLVDADDRLNLARACAQMSANWLPEYLARSIAEEETGEKARAEMLGALLLRSVSVQECLMMLGTAFEVLRPNTEMPGDTVARRLTRTLAALREVLIESELDAGDDLGNTFHRFIAHPLAATGRPEDEKVQIDLAREVLLTVHDIVRTRISVVADPQMYRVVDYCRKLCGGRLWPDDLKKPLERLITDVTEALVLIGRQGQCDQGLLAQLDILCNYPERARAVARELVVRHPELPETVRDWLEQGRIRIVRQASKSAIETAARNADESIGLALHEARQARLLRDSLNEPLTSNLEIYEPSLASATQELLNRIQVLAVQVEQAASLRLLDLYGVPGEDIDVSPKFFTVVGDSPRQRMTVKQPAVVRKRPDGTFGEVVTKGLVE